MLLLLLGICGFSSALAARSIDPLVTSIARDFAVPVSSVALLSSAFTLPYSLGQPFLGPLGDALGKAVILKACMWLLGLCLIGGTLAPSLLLLFSTRLGAGIAAGGIIPLALAMIGDRVPVPERQVAISRFLAAVLIGQLLGAMASGALAGTVGWRGAIAATAAVAVAAAVVASFKLVARAGAPRRRFSVSDAIARYRLVFQNPKARVCYGTVFVEGIAIYGVVPFVGGLLEARHVGGPAQAGYVIAGLGLGGLGYTALVSPLVQFLGVYGMMACGGLLAALGLCGVIPHVPWPLIAAAFVLIGFGFFMLHNALQNQATELAPTARGSAVALHAFFFFLGQALGPALFAAELQVSAAGALAFQAVTIMIAGLLAAYLLKRADQQ
jgi:predicted MFS family arabinose efflux permease